MSNKKLIFGFMFVLGFGLPGLQAQECINATGVTATGVIGSVTYSVGQTVYNYYTGTNGSVAQGVQQPYEISEVTGFEGVQGINLYATICPNPTTCLLELKVISEMEKDLSFQLYDANGKLLQTRELSSTEAQIDMSSYIPSTYFVRVIKASQSVKVFKVIKI